VADGPGAGIPAQEKVQLEGLGFKADGVSLRRNSKPVLDAAAEILRSEPDKKIYVDAYCDCPSGKKATLRLAQQRADIVKSYLETQGISSERMIARGCRAKSFSAANISPLTREQTSRVELIPFATHPAPTDLAYSVLRPASLN
jgi:OmpA-OmpF porin, OOP family